MYGHKSIKLKSYPHFDKYISNKEIQNLITDPQRVAKNTFYPFIEYTVSWKKFGRNPKKRKIRYASRRDAYIFSHYRNILSEKYEAKLLIHGLQNCPIAYRKISAQDKPYSGKCNIHFARDAFNEIIRRGECFAITLDINNFFECLDHGKLQKLWCDLLNVQELPPDHKAVFKNITNYRVVDRDECYERLGYYGEVIINGKVKKGLKQSQKEIPMQLCSPSEFRQKICGNGTNYNSLIRKNEDEFSSPRNFGIPQGAPISDLLANLYLIHFDKEIFILAKEINGYYQRYSDDILFICPNDQGILKQVINCIESTIKIAGNRLVIKKEKTNITEFYYEREQLKYRPYMPNIKNSTKKMEYLGFSFDGQKALIKDGTISGYYRKMTFGIRKEAKNLVARLPSKTPEEIIEYVNFTKLYQKYSKIEDFEPLSKDYGSSNFWTYVKRASTIMESMGTHIYHQLRKRLKKLRMLLQEAIKIEYKKAQRLEK